MWHVIVNALAVFGAISLVVTVVLVVGVFEPPCREFRREQRAQRKFLTRQQGGRP